MEGKGSFNEIRRSLKSHISLANRKSGREGNYIRESNCTKYRDIGFHRDYNRGNFGQRGGLAGRFTGSGDNINIGT